MDDRTPRWELGRRMTNFFEDMSWPTNVKKQMRVLRQERMTSLQTEARNVQWDNRSTISVKWRGAQQLEVTYGDDGETTYSVGQKIRTIVRRGPSQVFVTDRLIFAVVTANALGNIV